MEKISNQLLKRQTVPRTGLYMARDSAEGDQGVNDNTTTLAKQIVELKPLLQFSLIFSIWTCVAILAFFAYALTENEYVLYLVIFLLLICLSLAVYYAFFLLKAYRSIKVLDRWEGKYYAYAHLVAFEFTDRDESLSVVEDVAKRANELFPGTSHGRDRATSRWGVGRAHRDAVEINAVIKVRGIEHRFDAVLNRPRKRAFIRCFGSRQHEVSAHDLAAFSDEVKSAVKGGNSNVMAKYAISENGFSTDAMRMAEQDKKMVLINIEGDRYRIVASPYVP